MSEHDWINLPLETIFKRGNPRWSKDGSFEIQKMECRRCGMIENSIGLQVLLALGLRLNCDDSLVTKVLDE